MTEQRVTYTRTIKRERFDVYRCYHAHPTNPCGHEGCHLTYAHYGPCAHRKLVMWCRHRGGWYPCEHYRENSDCPTMNHDQGDVDPLAFAVNNCAHAATSKHGTYDICDDCWAFRAPGDSYGWFRS